MVQTLITLIIGLAILGIAWWAVDQFSLPQPIRIAVIAIFAIIAILFLAHAGGVLPAWR